MRELVARARRVAAAVAGAAGAGKRLPEVRTALAEYVEAVHAPFGALGTSPYTVAGELGACSQAPKIEVLDRSTATSTRTTLAAADRALSDLAAHARSIGNPCRASVARHAQTLYTEDDLERVASSPAGVERAARRSPDAARVATASALPAAATLADVEALAWSPTCSAFARGAPPVLQSDAWNAPPRGGRGAAGAGARSCSDCAQRLVDAADGRGVRADARGRHRLRRAEEQRMLRLPGVPRRPLPRDQAPMDALPAAAMRRRCSSRPQTEAGRPAARRAHASSIAPETSAAGCSATCWQGERPTWARLDAYVALGRPLRRRAIERGLADEPLVLRGSERPDVSP